MRVASAIAGGGLPCRATLFSESRSAMRCACILYSMIVCMCSGNIRWTPSYFTRSHTVTGSTPQETSQPTGYITAPQADAQDTSQPHRKHHSLTGHITAHRIHHSPTGNITPSQETSQPHRTHHSPQDTSQPHRKHHSPTGNTRHPRSEVGAAEELTNIHVETHTHSTPTNS